LTQIIETEPLTVVNNWNNCDSKKDSHKKLILTSSKLVRMGRQIQYDGVVYCDWRINVRSCVGEEFFFGVLAYSTVAYFLASIMLLVAIFFRV